MKKEPATKIEFWLSTNFIKKLNDGWDHGIVVKVNGLDFETTVDGKSINGLNNLRIYKCSKVIE